MKYHRTCASFIIYDISEYILRDSVFGHFLCSNCYDILKTILWL